MNNVFVMGLHKLNSVCKVVPEVFRNLHMYLVHSILNSILFNMFIYLVNNKYWMHNINTDFSVNNQINIIIIVFFILL